MYGTVFSLNVKEGHKEKLIEVMDANDRTPDGMVAWFLMNPDDDGKDLFVYKNEIKMEGFKTLKEKQEVGYTEGVSDKGPCAINVILK